MKRFYAILTILISLATYTRAQTAREVHGMVTDSTKQALPGSTIKLTSDQNDNATTIANTEGKFSFTGIKGLKLTLTISSIGFEGIIKHYTLNNDGKPADVGTITLKAESRQLNAVTVVGTNAVTMKEDTVDYKVSAYKVRQNAPIEDVLKKVPGVDVDPTSGAVTAQGQQVTKVRINGKDYMGGDVTSLTRNLPADLAESIQVIDDYGDQANLTGIKTGEPNKILNIVIRRDKNYGQSTQITVGDGYDGLPKPQNNDNRYLGSVNIFKFNGDQQISVLGNLNNTNVNTFSFGSANGGGNRGGGGGGGGGGNFGGGGGGGGRGNAARATAGGLTNNQNGINTARSIGANFRDQWGTKLSVYGSYSFADNESFTNSVSQQKNLSDRPSSTDQTSTDDVGTINHRFTWNMEYKPDTINYLKVTPTFNYSKSVTNSTDQVLNQIFDTKTKQLGTNNAYSATTYSNSSAPELGLSSFYNHRFGGKGRNLSINLNLSTSSNDQSSNPLYIYTAGPRPKGVNQLAITNGKSNTIGAGFSYIEPLGKVSFLEFNYSYNRTYNSSDKRTDTLIAANQYSFYPLLSNNYNFTFTTNRVGLNYRVVEAKYNYTLGLGLLPVTLDGTSETTNITTRKTNVNFAPTARFVYNFSRSNTFSANYNGNSNQPSFNQLQPVFDFSNAAYPFIGNPDLKPEFSNSISLRYNKFSFQTGNVLFTNLSFTQTNNKISTNVTTIPRSAVLAANPTYSNLQGTNLTEYINTGGYYSGNAFFTYAKPWAQRRYTLLFNGSATYTNNVGLVGSVDSVTAILTTQKNIAKNLVITPGVRFRFDLTEIMDAQILTNYSINKTSNSIKNDFTNSSANVRTLTLGINGKNYLWKNWTVSYDFSRNVNYGYTVPVTNPNIFNAYIERRFLKNNVATIRASAFDIFNQNTGFSSTTSPTSITQTNTNRLGRYFLMTFTFRLSKFAGRAPAQGGEEGRGNRGGGGGFGGGPGGGGPGGGGPSIY